MDFSAWSPSHLIVAGLAFATIIGQTIAVLARLKTTTERLEKQSEIFVHAMERLENRIDKRIDEVRSEVSEIRSELSRLNQNHIDHLSHHQPSRED
ncbi:DUF2970 domain-containing protein [Candidatus Poribacteria bacterium]|nr:DUF2970 domain-containing protein [Candidatus Poribacteria bacterium]